jgi:hypothetical protein
MASNLSGLFGGMTKSPEQYRQESIQGMRVSPAQMGQQSLNQQLISQMSNVGANIGSLAGGMMGGQTQQQGDDQRVQEVMKGVDFNSSEGLMAASKRFSEEGFPEQAFKTSELALSRAPKNDVNASLLANFTTASVAAFNKSKNPAELVRYTPEEKAKISSYGQQLVDEGLKVGSPEYQAGMQAYNKAAITGKAKGQSTTIELPGDSKAVDIPKFRSDLQNTVKPYTLSIDAADTVIAAIDLGIDGGNFVAAKGAAVALVKAFGDGTVSRIEAEKNGADPSIIGGGIDAINKMFTGTASIDTMKKLRKTAQVLKKLNTDKRNKELNVQRGIAKRSKIPNDDVDLIFSGFSESETKRTVVNTGTIIDAAGAVRKVVKYSDGSVEYAN